MSEGSDGDSHGTGDTTTPGTARAAAKTPRADDKGKKKQRTGDVGRALRSVYDDTLREDVPNDFLNLLDKLD